MKFVGKNIFLFLSLLVIANNIRAAGIKQPKPQNQNTVKFTENKSQWDKRVLYRAQLDGGVLFLENNCFTYNFYDKEAVRKNHAHQEGNSHQEPIRGHAFRMRFLNALPNPSTQASQTTPDYANFFIGKDQKKWASEVKNYKEINYSNLYSGIGLQVLGMENSIKYNFLLAPNTDANQIQLQYEGLDKLSLKQGALQLKTSVNELLEEKPYAYQLINGEKKEVKCEFVLENNTVHFRFPKGYNKNEALVIDPILVFACSSGSLADNFGMTATYDDNGNLYAGGTVFGVGYPTTLGAYDTSWNGPAAYLFGRTDVVITKYDSTGTFLQYSTYLGGLSGTEVVSSLIVNPQNELMLFGATGSNDFPVTATAYDTSFNGGPYLLFGSNGTQYDIGTDLYVAKFNINGTALLASSYIGGTQNDGANSSSTLIYNYGDYYRGEIQTDAAGNCYVASCTFSTDFPTTAGSYQPNSGGGMDGVVFKMDPNLSGLIWSTYLGGSADDGCYALTLDNLQNVYTTGGTGSSNFPTTAGTISTVYNGGVTDGFISKLKNDGSALLNSTFVGTVFYDQSFLIQLDNFDNVYIIGQSEGNMPVTAGVYSNANSKQFIWKVDNSLSTILLSTIFGNGSGTVNISPSAFLVDICGNIYACGWGGNLLTSSPTVGLPITPGAFQTTTDGYNFYLLVLSPNAASLLYATYFGGGLSREHVDGGTSRFDKKGIVYHAVCAGCGGNDDFPVTPGSWPNTGSDVNHNSQDNNCNMGVFKFDFQAAGVNANASISPNDTLCPGDAVTFNNSSSNALNYLWDFGDGTPTSNLASPTHTYPNPGTYPITLIAFDSTGCILSDTSYLSITVAPFPTVNLGSDLVFCQTPHQLLDAGTSGTIYNWSTGQTTQTVFADSAGTYWVEVSNGHCSAYDSVLIQEIILNPDLGNDTNLCAGQSILLDVFEPGLTYLWSTGSTTPSITVNTPGTYWVTVFSAPCSKTDTIQINYIAYPVVSLPPAIIICPNDSVNLDPGSGAMSYLWSTGDTTPTIYASNPGTYVVTASNFQCSTSDSIVALQIVIPHFTNDTTLCAGQLLPLNVFYPGASYLWSTGATTSSINVLTAGTYWVTVTASGCTQSDTINVNYLNYPIVNLSPAITICPGDSVLLDAGSPATAYAWSVGDTTQTIYAASSGTYIVTVSNQHCSTIDSTVVHQILFPDLIDSTLCEGQSIVLSNFSPGATYSWSTGETTSDITVSSAGQYWVSAISGFCVNNDTANIAYVPYPVVSLPTTVEVCPGASVTLNAGGSASNYLWSNGEQTSTIDVSAGGYCVVTASNQQCSVVDSTYVKAIPAVNWTSNISLCNVEKYILDAGTQANSYLWSTGETTSSIAVAEAGTYWVVANTTSCRLSDTVTVEGGLGSGILWFPNSFTPNSNGLNDFFTGIGSEITYFDLMIFDRWGELIFETENQTQGWDGYYKGKLVEQDVYVWKVKYKTLCSNDQLFTKIGHVTLVR